MHSDNMMCLSIPGAICKSDPLESLVWQPVYRTGYFNLALIYSFVDDLSFCNIRAVDDTGRAHACMFEESQSQWYSRCHVDYPRESQSLHLGRVLGSHSESLPFAAGLEHGNRAEWRGQESEMARMDGRLPVLEHGFIAWRAVARLPCGFFMASREPDKCRTLF